MIMEAAQPAEAESVIAGSRKKAVILIPCQTQRFVWQISAECGMLLKRRLPDGAPQDNREGRMHDMKKWSGMMGLIICGLAGLGLLIGMIAHLGDTLIRICGVVLMASLVFTVYRLVKDRNA